MFLGKTPGAAGTHEQQHRQNGDAVTPDEQARGDGHRRGADPDTDEPPGAVKPPSLHLHHRGVATISWIRL